MKLYKKLCLILGVLGPTLTWAQSDSVTYDIRNVSEGSYTSHRVYVHNRTARPVFYTLVVITVDGKLHRWSDWWLGAGGTDYKGMSEEIQTANVTWK